MFPFLKLFKKTSYHYSVDILSKEYDGSITETSIPFRTEKSAILYYLRWLDATEKSIDDFNKDLGGRKFAFFVAFKTILGGQFLIGEEVFESATILKEGCAIPKLSSAELEKVFSVDKLNWRDLRGKNNREI